MDRKIQLQSLQELECQLFLANLTLRAIANSTPYISHIMRHRTVPHYALIQTGCDWKLSWINLSTTLAMSKSTLLTKCPSEMKFFKLDAGAML